MHEERGDNQAPSLADACVVTAPGVIAMGYRRDGGLTLAVDHSAASISRSIAARTLNIRKSLC